MAFFIQCEKISTDKVHRVVILSFLLAAQHCDDTDSLVLATLISFFKCRPCHLTTDGWIAMQAVAVTPTMTKLPYCG